MASLIPGYEYDIFISYRQKDNKGNRWVSEFVEALKTELESTFKEEISIYFDINPHDGLLETHDVDESLKEKLNCLIFIPIISRTYCDPKSFAWEYEFKSFVKQASQDRFGLKIKLPNGNISSRVLPVCIYDLEINDTKLYESIFGSKLRGIEFIYKEPGVNRPLHPDDDEKINLNKTKYRNQINKISNAVKEIYTSLTQFDQNPDAGVKEVSKSSLILDKRRKVKFFAGSVLAVALIILSFIFIPKLFYPKNYLEKSIAVMPFKLLSDEPEKQYLADGMMDEILLHLSKINSMRVISKTSMEQYRETNKTLSTIGRELNVSYLLEGSFQKFGDNVRLIVLLIKPENEEHVWASEYDRNWKNIFSVQTDVAQSIAQELHTIITPEEKKLIKKAPTNNMAAYDLYLKANSYRKDFEKEYYEGGFGDESSYQTAINLYFAALEFDPNFARAYTGLAFAYWTRFYRDCNKDFMDSCLILADKALSIDDKLDEAYFLKGRYYRDNGFAEKALENYDQVLKNSPSYSQAYIFEGYLFQSVFHDYIKSIRTFQKGLNFIHGYDCSLLLDNLGIIYMDVGFMDKAKYYFNAALELNKDSAQYLRRLVWLEFSQDNFAETLKLVKKAYGVDSTFLIAQLALDISSKHHGFAGSNDELSLIQEKINNIQIYNVARHEEQDRYRLAYAYWLVGKTATAELLLNMQINYYEELLKYNKDPALIKITQYDLAAIYAFKDDKLKAYQYLNQYSDQIFFTLSELSLMKHDPLLASIQNEEQFQQILRNMEAKYQAEHERVRRWLEEQGEL